MGLLVPPADAEALAGALVAVAHDEGLRASAAQAGPLWVRERFSIDRMVEETLAVYSQAIGIHFAGRRDR
jgi:glycosyltransferase involved in cell wall biosynthesis